MSSDFIHRHQPLDPEIHQPPVLDPQTFRHQPEVFQDIRITPFTPVVGGIVEGFSLKDGATVADPVREFLYHSLLKYGFLSFVPGSVNEETFESFSHLFGSPRFAGNPQAPRAGAGELNTIDSSHKKTRTNYIWHIDQAYRPNPQKFTALHAVKAPGFGGETLFADATAAYRLLDPKLAAWLDTLNVIHNGDQMGLISMSYHQPEPLLEARQKTPPLQVPLVRVHPETGAKQLFPCELYAQRVLGLPRIVSDHVLHIVFEYLRSPEVVAQYHWQDGATLIWDNRIVHHRGVFNYGGQQRVLHRAVID
ncbi:TauD/TfdA dioxygenase family protein [Brenneria tiliae]|uniref:TauD/TfdA dioxygenase family protein n=1 Tax=Brenneria tiliae TaxID=2914984 RepID=UPI002014B903|nr:TauD/TfdA family dioxygenase [Brenneria tiliae]MCL2898352.1 TauD/TfdA family dioxygenase [Brenneria tiliae]MCL2902702.1 TauD/TfdA family dioxygenase [Brenneria tiliae]